MQPLQQRPRRRYQLTQSNKLHRKNHENIGQQLKIQLDFNLTQQRKCNYFKHFNRDLFKLLSKNLNFVPMQ